MTGVICMAATLHTRSNQGGTHINAAASHEQVRGDHKNVNSMMSSRFDAFLAGGDHRYRKSGGRCAAECDGAGTSNMNQCSQ